jgi:hypothetical protein
MILNLPNRKLQIRKRKSQPTFVGHLQPGLFSSACAPHLVQTQEINEPSPYLGIHLVLIQYD